MTVKQQRIFALADVANRKCRAGFATNFPDTSRKSCYVSYRGKVYDITTFMPDHPGGDDIILEWAGKDIGQIMAEPSSHVHSRSAYEMMDEYCVGELGGDEQIVSESKSIDGKG